MAHNYRIGLWFKQEEYNTNGEMQNIPLKKKTFLLIMMRVHIGNYGAKLLFQNVDFVFHVKCRENQ